jgi:hypothetical protein
MCIIKLILAFLKLYQGENVQVIDNKYQSRRSKAPHEPDSLQASSSQAQKNRLGSFLNELGSIKLKNK